MIGLSAVTEFSASCAVGSKDTPYHVLQHANPSPSSSVLRDNIEKQHFGPLSDIL